MTQGETNSSTEMRGWRSTGVMMTDRGRGREADHTIDTINIVEAETKMIEEERGVEAPQVIAVMTIIRRKAKETNTKRKFMQTQNLVQARE